MRRKKKGLEKKGRIRKKDEEEAGRIRVDEEEEERTRKERKNKKEG